jgi:imidazolonepropionase-like amidohydrolase
VIKVGRLVDPDLGTVETDQVIVIRANKFEAIGKNLAVPHDATVIDLSKMTALPGLINCHTHLADGKYGEGDPMLQLKKSASQSVLESIPNARVTLESGFTTVRDVGVYRALNDVACVTQLIMGTSLVRECMSRARISRSPAEPAQ